MDKSGEPLPIMSDVVRVTAKFFWYLFLISVIITCLPFVLGVTAILGGSFSSIFSKPRGWTNT